jgi:drug/metabolite transporter (DMT)-like permease
MTGITLTLVLFSGLAHASWNLLLKHSRNQEIFVWGLQITQVVLFLPLAIILIWNGSIEARGWWFILGSSFIHILYFLLLSRSYIHADFSLVYPLARGTGPALIPLLGVALLHEKMTVVAIFGVTAIVGGIFTAYWWGHVLEIVTSPLKFLKDPGSRYALLTGVTIAGYSVWDKVGVHYVNPLLYMYLLSLGTAMGLLPYILWKHGAKTIGTELRFNKLPILGAGILTFIAYAAVLSALQFSNVSYVSPAREVGIVFSVLLGAIVLREPLNTGRIVGSIAIGSGVFLIALG